MQGRTRSFTLLLRTISIHGDIGRRTLCLCSICVNGDCGRCVLVMILAVLRVELTDPFRNQLIEQWMRPKGRAQAKLDPRMPPVQFVAGGGEISPQMNSGRQEVRDHQHTSCASSTHRSPPAISRWLGELKKAGFDDRVTSLLCQTGGQLTQIVVGGLLATAVCNQQNGGSCGRLLHDSLFTTPGTSPERIGKIHS